MESRAHKYLRVEMNLIRDLQKQFKKRMKDSAIAQLRKTSKDSVARPKAEKIYYQQIKGCNRYDKIARGKAAAKRKFKVYPLHMRTYASKFIAGKIKDPSE